jgi:hypothetical protein
MDCEGMTVGGAFHWESIVRSPKRIVLRKARVGQLYDDPASWPTEHGDVIGQGSRPLDLTAFTYDQIGRPDLWTFEDRLSWIRQQTGAKGEFVPQPYTQLAQLYRADDLEQRRTLIARQNDLRKFGDLGRLSWTWNWLMKWVTGHGHQPWRALISLIVVWFLAVGMVWTVKDYNAFVAAGPTANVLAHKPAADGASKCTGLYPCVSQWIYPVDAAIPVVNLHQSEYWAFNSATIVGTIGRAIFDFLTLLGWLLTTLLLAATAGLIWER